ncbi:MAG TPA: pilus assembly protein N-terminal domain-containing protein, partial [Xanthobacteraceae bacterium]
MGTTRKSTRATGLAVLIAMSCIGMAWIAPGAVAGNVVFNPPPTQTIHVSASDAESQSIALGVSKSVVIDLPRDIRDVLVADPKIANAVVRSSRRAYIIGTAVGQTNVFFFDTEGKQIGGFDIAVTR